MFDSVNTGRRIGMAFTIYLVISALLVVAPARATSTPTLNATELSSVSGSATTFTAGWQSTTDQMHVDDFTFDFPVGFTLNSSVVAALSYCSDTDFEVSACSSSSLIGHVSVLTTLDPIPLDPTTGNVYLRTPVPGERFRIGMTIGTPVDRSYDGRLTVDPSNGQVGFAVVGLADTNLIRSLDVTFAGSGQLVRNPDVHGEFVAHAAITWVDGSPPTSESASLASPIIVSPSGL